MFILSKLVDFLLRPSNFIAFIAALGLLGLLLGLRRSGRGLLAVAALFLIVAGWLPVGPAALKVLEERFPAPTLSGPVDGIILLGGAVDTHITATRAQPTLNDAGERITAMAELSSRFPLARILLSGGASDLSTFEPVTESAVARDLLVGLGVDPQRVEMEERSRNTCENAEQSFSLARPATGQQWLLVTSASHMPRAVACFRAAGFAVVPYPVDYRTRAKADLLRPVEAVADGLQALDLAAHEWIGLATYRLLGRTRELLPAP